jgi:transcription termination/antitermination protein NusG
MANTQVADGQAWYAVRTRIRYEHLVRSQLADKKVEVFLPTTTQWSQWKDRRKQIEWALFPGYCFARFDARTTAPVLSCRGVLNIVSFAGRAAAVDEWEVNNLILLARNRVQCDPCAQIPDGALVRVVDGPLRDVVGRLLHRDARHATVVLSVDLIGQAVRVQVDAAHIALHAAA